MSQCARLWVTNNLAIEFGVRGTSTVASFTMDTTFKEGALHELQTILANRIKFCVCTAPAGRVAIAAVVRFVRLIRVVDYTCSSDYTVGMQGLEA